MSKILTEQHVENNDKKEMSYEQAMKRITEITEKLERQTVSLDESIKLYKEGMDLTKLCDKKLKEVELELKKLTIHEVDEDNNIKDIDVE